MKLNRFSVACSLFVLMGAFPVHAQDFPSKPMRIVVPGAPGGSADIPARLMGGKLNERPVLQMTSEAFAAVVKSDIAKWRKVGADLNIKVD